MDLQAVILFTTSRLAIVNPVSAAVLFAAMTGRFGLSLLGISVAMLQAAGGLILLRYGLRMVTDEDTKLTEAEQTSVEHVPESHWKTLAVVPLAIPGTVGAGAITTVVIQSSTYSSLRGLRHSPPAVSRMCPRLAAWLATTFSLTGAPCESQNTRPSQVPSRRSVSVSRRVSGTYLNRPPFGVSTFRLHIDLETSVRNRPLSIDTARVDPTECVCSLCQTSCALVPARRTAGGRCATRRSSAGHRPIFMCPVLFRIRGMAVRAYPAMLYLGLLAGMTVGHRLADQSGLDPSRVSAAALLLAAAALVGARLLYVALHWSVYRAEPRRIWRRTEGGAVLYGGLLLSLGVSPPLLSALGLPFGSFWDVAAVIILVAMVPARIGCFLQGCCAGRPSRGRLAIYLPDHRGTWRRRVPVQLLEAAWAAILLMGTTALWPRRSFHGAAFLAVAAGYGVGRFVLEPLRETVDRIGPFSVQRTISLALVLASLIGFLR